MKLICIAKQWRDLPQKTLDVTGYTNVSFDELVIGSHDQRICPYTLEGFLEKYLKGQMLVQQFTQRYSIFYEQLIDYKKLTTEEETIMKEFRTVVENYAPDHINPKRVYSNEEEVRAAARKALACVKNNPYLASLTTKI